MRRSSTKQNQDGSTCTCMLPALISMPALTTTWGGSGAHPTHPGVWRQTTQAGAHTVPGSQTQPCTATKAQRP
jgi:hypothetical protein